MARKTLTDKSQVIGHAQRRSFAIQRDALQVDQDARTVVLAFASDEPIEHWFGKVILDHSKDAVMLDRLLSDGPLLENHNPDRQIGAVREASTDGHVSRATVQFSRRQSAEDCFQDVLDGICRSVSVGLMIHELILEESNDDEDTYRATKWEPLEISMVPVPADTSVGVGRSLDNASEPGGASAPSPAVPAATTATDSGASRANNPTTETRKVMDKKETATSPDLTRAQEIAALGELLGEVELAREYVAGDQTPAEFKAAVRAKQTAAQTQTPTEDPTAVAQRNGGGQQQQQLARVNSRATLKAFRGENGALTAHRFGNFLAAALHRHEDAIKFCREQGIAIKRAHSESDNESGGFLVPTEFEQTIIDLRLDYGVFRPNANVVPMSGGRREQPRRKGGLRAYPIGAGKNNRRLTESKQGWDLVGLDPKKVGVLAKYEEELSEDWLMATGDNFASEAAYAFAQYEDECGFIGDGSSDYHGITGVIPKLQGLSSTVGNIAGIVVASGNSWAEIVLPDILALVGRLPSFARKSGQVKWYCTNEFWATVLCRITLALGGVTMAEIEGEMRPVFLGKPVEEVEVMPHTEANSQIPLLYGNLAQAASLGDRRGMTVKMTDSNGDDFEEDIQAWKATQRFDIHVHDVGNASATASQRKAGPVVALQMASS
jgi:HK97 family phage major capsid protein